MAKKNAQQLLDELGMDVVMRTPIRKTVQKEPIVSIKRYGINPAQIIMNSAAIQLVKGNKQNVNIVFALSRDNSQLVVVVCDAEEHNSVLLQHNKAGTFCTSSGTIGTKLGVTDTIRFEGELVAMNRDVFVADLKKSIKNK